MKTKTGKDKAGTPVRKRDRDCENCTRTVPGASPFKLEKILVPVDFFDCSKKALQYAIPFARQFKAQMVFRKSTHGHTGRIHAFIGSVAADVTRLAPCPVLVVREHEKDFVPNEISPAGAGQDQPETAGTSHV